MEDIRRRLAMHGTDLDPFMARRALFRPDVHASRFGLRPAAGPTDLGDLYEAKNTGKTDTVEGRKCTVLNLTRKPALGN